MKWKQFYAPKFIESHHYKDYREPLSQFYAPKFVESHYTRTSLATLRDFFARKEKRQLM